MFWIPEGQSTLGQESCQNFWSEGQNGPCVAFWRKKNNGEIAFPACKFGKFEIGRGLFENFGKLEERSSKFLEIGKFEDFQMNDANKSKITLPFDYNSPNWL